MWDRREVTSEPPLTRTSKNVLKLALIRPASLGLEANNAVFYVLSSI